MSIPVLTMISPKLVDLLSMAQKVLQQFDVRQLLRWLLTSALAFGGVVLVTAQVVPPIRNFDATAHGAERQTWDIAQALDGTMAFANGAGLLLFDGVRWKLLPSPNGHTLRSVEYHKTQQKWLAGSYDTWVTWPARPLIQAQGRRSILQPPEGPREEWWNVLPHPRDSSMYFWQTFSRMASSEGGNSSAVPVPGNILFATEINDTLYLPALETGLFRLANDDWELVTDAAPLLNEDVVGVTAGPNPGELIIALRSGQLFSFHNKQFNPWPQVFATPWKKGQLNKLIRMRDGKYVVGTIGNGVYLLSPEGQVLSHVNKQAGLADDTVLSLFEDRQGDLWIGLDHGIAHLAMSRGINLLGQGLGTVYAIQPFGAQKLLIGTNQGLYEVSPFGKTQPKLLRSDQIWHLNPTAKGIIAGTNEGTFIVDEAGNVRPIGVLAGGWCWLPLSDTTALAGTYTGIEKFNLENGRWTSEGKLPGFDQPVQQLMWSGAAKTILLANHPQDGPSEVHFNDAFDVILKAKTLNTGPGLLSTRRSPNGAVSFHTEAELLQYKDGQMTRQSGTAPILFEMGDAGIALERTRITRWNLNGDTSFYELQPNVEYPVVEQIPNGLSNESTARFLTAVGLTRGLALFDTIPKQLAQTPARATVVNFGKRGKTVNFSQVRFDQPPLWQTQLVGIDSSYTNWSTQAEYQFPVLPTGDYELRWMSNDGQSGTLTWTIPPRWYETTAARLAFGLVFLFGFWAIRFYYRRRLKQQAHAAEVERERQLTAERLQTRAAELEAEIEVSKRAVALKDAEVDHRNRELARTTMTLVRQNETLLRLKESLSPLPRTGDVGKAKRQSIRLIEGHLSDETDWDFFDEHFDAVHAGFLKKLHEQHPSLTPGDLRLAALLRLNLPSKEIAPLLHISVRGVENKRYRLRKKLGLAAEVNLTEWVIEFA